LIWLDQAVDQLVRARHARSDNDAVRLARCAEHLLANINTKHPPTPRPTPMLHEMLAAAEAKRQQAADT
jgi:hypothetical protein